MRYLQFTVLAFISYSITFTFISCNKNNYNKYTDTTITISERVDDLISKMTLEEKAAQTFCLSAEWFIKNGEVDSLALAKALANGLGSMRDYFVTNETNSVKINNFIQKFCAKHTRLGVPVIMHGEGLHGYVNNNATCFPQAIAIAGTWNLELINKVYSITAAEARSRGIHQILAPILDVARDPRWGRLAETFGEDPYLTGEIGVQIVNSYQGINNNINANNHVIATLKHFPGSAATTGGMNVAPMVCAERELREVFLYPFKQAVTKAGALGVMAFYGEYDGIPVHTNNWLLRDILRNEWGFKGIVVSDYFALELLTQGWQWEFNRHQVAADSVQAAELAIKAGVNIEMVILNCYAALPNLVKSGKVPVEVLDNAVKEILTLKFKLGLFEQPFANEQHANLVSNMPNSKAVALESAKQSIILLKNKNNLLPLNFNNYKNIAIIGPNAKDTNLGDYSTKKPKYFVSVFDGIKNRTNKNCNILYAKGSILPTELANAELNNSYLQDEFNLAIKTAQKADIVIMAMGGNKETDREGRDQSHLHLPGNQSELIKEICKLGKPVILCLFGGKIYAEPQIYENVNATFICWSLGQETGNALAAVIFGDCSPSGKLTVSIPASTGHLPCYYNKKPSAYNRNYFNDPYTGGYIYPFGYGLSYTQFKISDIVLNSNNIKTTDTLKITANITNLGKANGAEVVQVYLRHIVSSVTQPMKQLKDFNKVFLKAGETKSLNFTITPEKLKFYNRNMKFEVEQGEYEVMIGNSSLDSVLQKFVFNVK